MIDWGDSSSSRTELTASLKAAFEAWRIAPEIVERAAHDGNSVIDFLRENRLNSGRLIATYNGTELWTEITYVGTHEPPVQPKATEPAHERIDAFANEEAAVFVGLRDFLRSIAADRKRVWRRRDHLTVRLTYEIA